MPGTDVTKNQRRYRIHEPRRYSEFATIPIGTHHSGIVRGKKDGWETQSVRIGKNAPKKEKEELMNMVRRLRK